MELPFIANIREEERVDERERERERERKRGREREEPSRVEALECML